MPSRRLGRVGYRMDLRSGGVGTTYPRVCHELALRGDWRESGREAANGHRQLHVGALRVGVGGQEAILLTFPGLSFLL